MSIAQLTIAIAAVVCAFIGAGAWWEVQQATKALKECQAQRDGANRSVLVQNTRIETWQEAASQAQQQGAVALAAAVATTASTQAELKRLRAATPLTCTDAVRQVREGMQ